MAKAMPRLRERYLKEVKDRLLREFGYGNPNAVPRLEKVVLNMGIGEGASNVKLLDQAVVELGAITGQRAVITRARKSIANFKLREGMPIGVRVTLRGERMWEFMDRLFNIALPRVADFRGVSNRGFDGRGNYTLGLKDQLIFPEIAYEKVEQLRGMNVTFVTSAKTDKESMALLAGLGMPFQKRQESRATGV